MKVGDLGHGADGVDFGIAAADFPAFANQDDAEALALAHTAAHHIEVTCFKDPQRQRTLGEQHDVEREQCDRIQIRLLGVTPAQFGEQFLVQSAEAAVAHHQHLIARLRLRA